MFLERSNCWMSACTVSDGIFKRLWKLSRSSVDLLEGRKVKGKRMNNEGFSVSVTLPGDCSHSQGPKLVFIPRGKTRGKIITTTRLSARIRGTICLDWSELKRPATLICREPTLIGSAWFFHFCYEVVDPRGCYFEKHLLKLFYRSSRDKSNCAV